VFLRWKRTLLGLTNLNDSYHPRCHSQRLSYGAAQYEESLIKLSDADTQIEDLKLQLDALGAEEMLIQLTERNLMLSEVSQVYALPNRANALFVQVN